MKKFVVAIVALLYVAISCGATIHVHYCMDKLVDWSLGHNNDESCSECGMEKTLAQKGCCKDEHKLVKLEDDQKITEPAVLNLQWPPAEASPGSFVSYSPPALPAVVYKFPLSHAPPAGTGPVIYLRNRNFRI